MKRFLSAFLAAVLLLSLLSTVSFADAPISVSFTGSGEWRESSTRFDNTKDYTVTFDLNLPSISAVTGTDVWADEGKFVIRNEATDEYIYFRVMSYRNGSGMYQIATAANVWSGSSWSGEDFFWSENFSSPITAVSMKISHAGSKYSWVVTNQENGATLCGGAVTQSHLREGVLSCTSAQVMFCSNPLEMQITNVSLLYGKAEGPEDPPADGQNVVFSGSGDWLDTSARADNTKDYSIDYDLNLPKISSATGTDVWADEGKFVIRNEATDEYVYVRVMSYINGSGQYHIASAANVWSGSSWSGEDFFWSEGFSAPVTDVHVRIEHTGEAFTWTVTEKDNGATLCGGAVTQSHLRAGILNCDSAQLRFGRNSTQMQPANVVLKYSGSGEPPVEEFDSTKTPEDFGWQTDGSNYAGWQVSSDGAVLQVSYDGNNSNRIWKELISDPDNFTLTFTAKVLNWRLFFQVLGTTFELNCWGGSGSQIFDKETWSWFNAIEQECKVTVARIGGGDLIVKYEGKGNPTPLIITKAPDEPGNKNVCIGVIDATGSAKFSDIVDLGVSGQNPGDFGWDTDEFDGVKDYTGWGTVDGINITADYDTSTGNHRIWRSLISNPESYLVTACVKLGEEASCYLKIQENTLELDARGGNGNQVFVKLNGEGQEWIDAADRSVEVYLFRYQDRISYSVVGEKDVRTWALSPAGDGKDVELGTYAGRSEFADVRVTAADDSLRAVPFGTIQYSGDWSFGGLNALAKEIGRYQNHLPTAQSVEADQLDANLVLVSFGTSDLLAGKPTSELLAACKAKLESICSALPDDTVFVVLGLPYLPDESLNGVSLADYAAALAGLRALAEDVGAIYVDCYSAMGERAWTLNGDGWSAVGNEVIVGEIMEQLLRRCTCLAVNATAPIKPLFTPTPAKTQAALDAFTNASDLTALRDAVESEELGLNLSLFRSLDSALQAQVLNSLLAADRAGLTHADADALFLEKTMNVSRNNPRPDLSDKEIARYVSVGDSITEGACAVDPRTDAYAPVFASILKGLSGGKVSFVNRGISGTRMCTITDNGVFPPAKDTVDDYIVAEHPDLLSVAYGINDYHAGTTKEEFLTTYAAYVEEIQEKCPGTIILLLSLTAKGQDQSSADLKEWNAGIREIAETHGCIYVDTYYDMRGVEWLLTDNLHPTNAGYRVMANAVLRTFNEYYCFEGQDPGETHSPAEFGWETDEDDFAGWTAADAANLSAEYALTHNGHRVWKSLLTNQTDFTVDADMTIDAESSTYVKALGVIAELDGRHGNGAQAYPKINGENGGCDWIAANGGKLHVRISRSGGDLTIEIAGNRTGESWTYTATPSEENENLELGLYAGSVKFENITVVCGTAPIPPDKTALNAAIAAAEAIDRGKYTAESLAALDKALAAAKSTAEDKDATQEEIDAALATLTAAVEALKEKPVEPPVLNNPFTDVKDSDYFYDAVLWAVNAEPQITNGTGATTFSPNDTCTRAQVVTFLWRAKGCPEPTKSENPFKDVKETDYFYKAVLWAVENEITNGTSANTFSPNAGCTRGQVVTFLWRAEGKPAPASTLNPFGDVKSGEFYYDAVLWAVEKDITKGTSDTTFSPSATCTRGQIVTFLYRDLA